MLYYENPNNLEAVTAASYMIKQYTPISFLWSIIKPYKLWYLLMLQAPIVAAFYPLMYNYSVKLLIDLFSQNKILQSSDIFYPIIYFVGAHVMLDAGWRINNFAAWRSQPYVRKELLCRSYEYLTGQPYKFFQNNLSGSLVSKVKGISDGYYFIWRSLEHSLTKPVANTLVSGFCLLFVNRNLFFMLVTFAFIFIPFITIFYGRLGKIQREMQNDYHKIIGFVADGLINIFTIFAFATRRRELKKLERYYDVHNIPLQNTWLKLDFWTSAAASVMYWLILVAIFAYLIYLRNIGEISIGDIAFTTSMAYVFAENIWHLSDAANEFINAYASFKSAFSIIETVQDTIDKPESVELKITKGEIIFKDLSFVYEDGAKIFTKLNLRIKAGERVGLVGHSGAGKSTLIALLLKNFDRITGDILIDGKSIYDVTSDSIRSQISLIPQDIMLFHRPIGENIGYAKEGATQKEVEAAAKLANIHEFIESLPNKYETLVGERGIKLSGGQRQRIAIARAIVKNAPILLLDEATSSLDSQTEQQIQESINSMLERNKATVIAIAHRLSTIRHMDRIVVMDNGEVVEEGSFKKLISKKKGKFRELWDHQVGGMLV